MRYESKGYVIGVDLGQRQDFTAIVIVEKLRSVSPEAEPTESWSMDYKVPRPETKFRVRETAGCR